MFEESDYKPTSKDVRPDGTMKGRGFFGGLKRLDDPKGVSSELSIGVNWGNGEKTIPTMVPTLNKSELEYLLSTPEERLNEVNPDIYQQITRKAVRHARDRESQGLPFFAKEGEQQKFPNLKAINDDSFASKLKKRIGLD